MTQNKTNPRDDFHKNVERIDNLVRKSFQQAHVQIPSPSVCLMAVGGYGRGDLAPFSDVDLLLLYASSEKKNLPPLVEKILYPLWDAGLEVNCSSRSIDECLKMARSDLYVKTGLIDGRYLDGEYDFFRKLYGAFTKNILHRKVRKFAELLAQDVYTRHRKYEDPAYTLEPNLKEGPGGLRDFQTGRWLIRAKYKTDRWDSILFPDHSRMLEKSLDFLLEIRNQLHRLCGRKQDGLTFEMQEKIAPIFGFQQGAGGIEEMMRQVHLSTQKISNFSEDILGHVLEEPSPFKKAFFFFNRRRIDRHFRLINGEIVLEDPVLFKKDSAQLMALFQRCQTYRARTSFQVEEAVLEALPFIDDRFRESGKINRMFLSILKEAEGSSVVLRKMHELGFLSRYLPEFSKIEGSVHYDLYHVHPVDIHSILAVEEMEKLGAGAYEKDSPILTSLIREIENPEVLFLVTLLHDIGKRREGDHTLLGSEIIRRIVRRMGLPDEDTESAAFLVRNHLLMLETAFRRDLQDEQAILHFAEQVKTPDRLKRLYLLTFADIKAVGPDTWTSWKGTLLMELFLKTLHLLEKRENTGFSFRRDEILKKLQNTYPQIASEYAEILTDRYLSAFSWEDILHHIELVRQIDKIPLQTEWKIEPSGQTKVTICTKDRYGLFYKIAGSMFLNRLNILEAKIHTLENGVVLDTFWVEGPPHDMAQRFEQFKKELGGILSGKILLKDLLLARKESSALLQKVVPKVFAEINVNNQDSDFYTIVEVTAEDRLGILYEMTQALTDHGCNIYFARVSTLGNRIVDVFYIQDTWGEKITARQNIEDLKETLLRCISQLHVFDIK